jgi:3-oxoadipate enol-lactonase
MATVALKDVELHYAVDGVDGAPVLVLSNSLGTDLHLWEAQMPALSQHFRVVRYDTRGHGQSVGRAGEYRLDELGGDVLGLLDHLGVSRFHVAGISLGGITALWLAVNAPERVLGLMPCNTAARIGSVETWRQRMEQVSQHGTASIAEATMERWFTAAFRRNAPARVEAARQMLLHTGAAGYVGCCAALRDADLRGELASITAPALAISGTYDPVTPPADGQFLQQHIAGAKFMELAAAHISNVEAAEAFQDAMLGFLLPLEAARR